MVALKSSSIGVHFFCIRAIDEVPRMVKKSFEVSTMDREVLKRKLAAECASCKNGSIAKLIPELNPRLNLFTELRQGGEIAAHEAYYLSHAPDAVLSLTHGLCGARNFFCQAVERGEIEAKGDTLFAVLADVALPVGAVAPLEQSSFD